MLWLGEGCSSYKHEKSLMFVALKSERMKVFACLCVLNVKMIWGCVPCKFPALNSIW